MVFLLFPLVITSGLGWAIFDSAVSLYGRVSAAVFLTEQRRDGNL